jgi:hypothetical protein
MQCEMTKWRWWEKLLANPGKKTAARDDGNANVDVDWNGDGKRIGFLKGVTWGNRWWPIATEQKAERVQMREIDEDESDLDQK